jgi:DNA-directed RNA polymerase subunit beta'
MLDMTLKDLERVLYFEQYVVVEPGLTPLKKFQMLTEEEYLDAQDEYGEESFTAASAPRPFANLLIAIDLDEGARSFATELRPTSRSSPRS